MFQRLANVHYAHPPNGAAAVWVVDPYPYGCGSKIGTQNGTLVSGNMDQNLWSPGGSILIHTHINLGRSSPPSPFGAWKTRTTARCEAPREPREPREPRPRVELAGFGSGRGGGGEGGVVRWWGFGGGFGGVLGFGGRRVLWDEGVCPTTFAILCGNLRLSVGALPLGSPVCCTTEVVISVDLRVLGGVLWFFLGFWRVCGGGGGGGFGGFGGLFQNGFTCLCGLDD